MVKRSKNKRALVIILLIMVASICILSGCNNGTAPKTVVSEQGENNEESIDPILDKLLLREVFHGWVTDDLNNKSWICTLCVTDYDSNSGAIIGQIEWPELNAIHRIEGNINGNSLTFEETDYIKKGSAYLGVKYTMVPEGEQVQGIWNDKTNHQQGVISIWEDSSTTSHTGPSQAINLQDDQTQGDDPYQYEYGYSGYNTPLMVYKISNPSAQYQNPRKILCVFAMHGFEDAFYKDGQILVDIANDLVNYFIHNREELKNYELLIIPSANPDGLKQGWTCNGPGRCQLSQGIDINMDFDYLFTKRTNKRNKTGEQAFTSPEAKALKELVIAEKPDIIIDFHGWINLASGDKAIADVFCKNLNLNYEPKEAAIFKGFFSGWAAKYAKSVLVEYPDPLTGEGICELKSDQQYNYNKEKLDELQYSQNTINSIREIIYCGL